MSVMIMDHVAITRRLNRDVSGLYFGPPVTHVYNPLDYAGKPYAAYLARYGRTPGRVLLVGMNPGPWGMVQTGIPFGEVEIARTWLEMEAPVGKPRDEHAKRPVLGFACRRSEVSGARLWGWARDQFKTPERFFADFLVINYCPLCFLEASGRNRTPDKLPAAERDPLFAACDRALRSTVDLLEPRCVIGIGVFAEKRIRAALTDRAVRVGRISHPSPANPLANTGWAARVTEELAACGVRLGPARGGKTAVRHPR